MAVVTRYFDTAAAGDGTGSSWANRAILFTGGAWSTVITAFAFTAGSDSLKCLIGPGTYAITAALASGSFSAGAPAAGKPLFMHACDASGNQISPPDPGWVSAAPAWSDSTLPVLATTTNIFTVELEHCFLRMLKFTASGRTGGGVVDLVSADWFQVAQSTSNTGARGVGSNMRSATNGVITMSGTGFDYAISSVFSPYFSNIRCVGNASAATGNRRGMIYGGSTGQGQYAYCTATAFPGGGFVSTSTNVAQTMSLRNCTLANNGGDGALFASTASQTSRSYVINCQITGNGDTGIDAQSATNVAVQGNRFRDNTNGNIVGLGNGPTDLDSYTTDSDDATEYVDAASGDFRIKLGAATWGKGYGAGDQPRRGTLLRGLVA
jgi:parallel beta-helix repeat protein